MWTICERGDERGYMRVVRYYFGLYGLLLVSRRPQMVALVPSYLVA